MYFPEDPLPFLQDLQVQAHSWFKPKAKSHLHLELYQHFTDASFGISPFPQSITDAVRLHCLP